MALRCGIVGLPNSGKSVIFNALTSAGAETADFPFSTVQPNIGLVPVPDERLEILHRHIGTREVVPAELQILDIAGLPEGASRGEGLGNKFLGFIKEVDALLHVVPFFERAGGSEGGIAPLGDIEVVETELALADLETVERNLERVARKARAGEGGARDCQELFGRVREALQEGRQVRSMELDPGERLLLRPLFLLTAKPVLFVANLGEGEKSPELRRKLAEVEGRVESLGSELVEIAGKFEAELSELPEEDRRLFLADAGLEETGLARLIRKAYHLLGLRTFFTVNEKEIHAWTFHLGDRCPRAAGAVHTDFEKRFIRARIFRVEDLEEHGSEAAIKAAGKLRVEGKDYEMQDGDVAFFLIGRP